MKHTKKNPEFTGLRKIVLTPEAGIILACYDDFDFETKTPIYTMAIAREGYAIWLEVCSIPTGGMSWDDFLTEAPKFFDIEVELERYDRLLRAARRG